MNQQHCQGGIPPKPPDINSPQLNNTISAFFKDKLLVNEQKETFSILSPPTYLSPMSMDTNEEEDKKSFENPDRETKVPISGEDKLYIYYPWRFSVIIKLLDKKILHQVIKRKLIDLWKPTETFPLIDLGEQYFIVKFNKEENLENVLKKGHGLSLDTSFQYNAGNQILFSLQPNKF